ncbi:tetratricopeptide repeat protein [Marinihelvus fidelis]|uniref:Tetratricopeptide repeat protein n=1 Tax=Marinihelvus fidelis TaxID=2613842 RepID=A0A5N0T7X4_9GAMM|nr:tetratricopeptide repeat protein [Marinihelvus fidelis]KAA9130871.1 tetratricopeptide repeat protein [Marinihelvus fidelis]
MKNRQNIRNRFHGIALAATLGIFQASTATAEEGKQRETRATVAMSQKVYETLTQAQALVENRAYEQAEAILADLRMREDLEPYETAQAWNLSAFNYYQRERYEDAIRAYDQVLSQPDMPVGLRQTALKTKAQLKLNVEDYRGTLTTIDRLMELVSEPAPDIDYTRGAAYFQLGEFRNALAPLQRAVSTTTASDAVPKEGWLLLLRGCYYQLKDFENMVAVLEDLIRHYPKDTYLLTLAGAYSELGDTLKQLVIMETLYEQGLISNSSHITNLANLYLLHETPLKAAELLDRELESGALEKDERSLRLLSQAWYAARENEKAIVPLQQAAERANDGQLYVRLAQSYLQLDRWEAAVDALQTGLDIGGIARTDSAHILLGMAYMRLGQHAQARRAFMVAQGDVRSRREAQLWVDYIDSEVRRTKALEQPVPDPRQSPLDALLEAAEDAT